VGLLAVLPVLLTVEALRQRGLGWDFRAFYLAGNAYLAGASPYPGHALSALANKQGFVYPAPVAALFVPFAVLPYPLALVLWLLGSVAALGSALWLLGVRDWRVFGALMLTRPAEQAVRLGTLMPALVLLLALVWRLRDREWLVAAAAGLLALSKLFLFPVLIWLAATRRSRAALAGAGGAIVVCVLAWLPLGLATIGSYPKLLSALAGYEQTFSYSLTSLGIALGLSSASSVAISVAAGAAVACAALLVGRTRESLSFRLALAAAFLMSPIVWGHYFVLLAVPLALRRPRLSPVWLAAAWIKPDTLGLRGPALWVALSLLVMAVQLDLVPSLGPWPAVRLPRQANLAVGVALVGGALVAASAAAEPGQTVDATLVPVGGEGARGGAAFVRVDGRELCWRVWTQAVPAETGSLRVEDVRAAARLTLRAVIGADGQSQGCARLDRGGVAVSRALVRRPAASRLVLTLRSGDAIGGAFRRT
jgi:hypothetical protein